MVEVLVEFDYDAEQPDELTIKTGDIIKNVLMSEGGWWEGELNGKKGMFPDNFVKVIEKDKPQVEEKKEAKTNQRASVRELASKLKDGVPVGPALPGKRKDTSGLKHKKAKVLYDYEPENEDELKIDVGDIVEVFRQEEEGWWEGSLNGKVGVFPSNFVEIIEEPEPEKTDKPPEEEKPTEPEKTTEIKGKKVIGIGLGNIFGGGPIKLRSTVPPAKQEKEQKVVEEAHVAPSPVVKREKPEITSRSKSKLKTPDSGLEVESKSLTFSKENVQNEDDANILNNVYDSDSSAPSSDSANILNNAYDSDSSILSSDILLSTNAKFPLSVSEEDISDCLNYPILQREESKIKYRYAAAHVLGSGDRSDLDDSNKENINQDRCDEKRESLSRKSSSLYAPDFYGSYVGYLNSNNSANSNSGHVVRRKEFTPQNKIKHVKFPRDILSEMPGLSNVPDSDDNNRDLDEQQSEDVRPQSAPSLGDKKVKEDFVFRRPFRPIKVRNLNEIEPQESPFLPVRNYEENLDGSLIASPDNQCHLRETCSEAHKPDLPTGNKMSGSQLTKCSSDIGERRKVPKKAGGYLSTLKQSGHLSPYIRALASKYQLFDDKDKSPECPPEVSVVQQDNQEALERELAHEIQDSSGPTIEPDHLVEEDTYVNTMFATSETEENFCERENRLDEMILRYKQEADEFRRIAMANAMMYINTEDESYKTPHDVLEEGPLCTAVDTVDNLSDSEKLAFERDLEENLKTEMEAYESFIMEGSPASEHDVLNTSFISDEAEELIPVQRNDALWVSPAPAHILTEIRHGVRSREDTSVDEETQTPDQCSGHELDDSKQRYEKHKRKKKSKSKKKKDAATSPIAELISYNTSMEESFVADSPIVSPLKIRVARPRYSSSLVTKLVDHDEIISDEIDSDNDDDEDKGGIHHYEVHLSEGPSEKKRKGFSWKKLFGLKKRKPVTLLSFKKLSDTTDGVGSVGEKECLTTTERVEQIMERVQDCGGSSAEDSVHNQFITWDGITNSIETFFTQRLESSDDERQQHSAETCDSKKSEEEEYTLDDIDSELEKCKLYLENAARAIPEVEYDAESQTGVQEMDKMENFEPASLGYLALYSFKLHLKKIQEGIMFSVGELDDRPAFEEDSEESGEDEDEEAQGGKNEEVEVSCDVDLSPDSPTLIASMTTDVKKLNLTMTPTASDAEMSQSLNAFLQEALKPIDDLSLQAATSGSDESDNDQFDSARDAVDVENPLKLDGNCYGNFSLGNEPRNEEEYEEEKEEEEEEELIKKDMRNRLQESVDRYPSFTFCSPLSNITSEVEEDEYLDEVVNPENVQDEEEEQSLYSEVRHIPLCLHGMALEEEEEEDYIPRYPGVIFDRSESPKSPSTPLPTPENEEKEEGFDLMALEGNDVENAMLSVNERLEENIDPKLTERYPKFSFASLPPLYEEEEDSGLMGSFAEYQSSTPVDARRSRRHRVNEYPSMFIGQLGEYDEGDGMEAAASGVRNKLDEACKLSHWTMVEISKMAREIVEEMFVDGTISEMQREIEAVEPQVLSKESDDFVDDEEDEKIDESFVTGDESERFYTDLDTDVNNTLEQYYTDSNDTDLDNTKQDV